MTTKAYSEVLKIIYQSLIDDYLQNNLNTTDAFDFGLVTGLQIALEKIEALHFMIND